MKRLFQILFVLSVVLNNKYVLGAQLDVGPSQAYLTISSALTMANPFDVINIHAGTYNEIVVIGDHGITLQNNGTDSVVLQGRIDVGVYNSVTIKGIEVTGWSGFNVHGISQAGGSMLTIINCTIHDGPATASSSGIYSRNSTKLLIKNNEVFRNNKGINVSSGHSTDGSYANGIIIQNNKIHDNPIDGIDLQGEYFTIEGNNIYNNIDTAWLTNHPDGIQLIASTVDGYTAVKHAKIKGNVIRNHTQNIFLEGILSDELSNCEDIHIYANVVFNENTVINGVDMVTAGSFSNVVIKYSKNVFVYNNTIGAASNNAIFIQLCANGTIFVKNNIINNPNKIGVYVQDVNDIADNGMDYNLYYNNKSIKWGDQYYSSAYLFNSAVPLQEGHGQDGDPKLSSWPDPRLIKGSPAIDKGVSLGAEYSVDKGGRARSGNWDIGAYEVIIPSPPQNLTVQ